VGLTSPALLVTLALIAAALLAAILRWWPRLAGPGASPVLLRIAALGTLQVSMLGLIFAAVNRSAEFYSSWSDLFGAQSGGAAIVGGQGPASREAGYGGAPGGPAAAPVAVSASSAVEVPGRRGAAGGRLQAVAFHGELSGLTVAGYVYLPPGYARAAASGPLPVAVVVSDEVGSSGNPYSARRIAVTAARQIAAGQLRPLILVMLPAQLGGHDQGCLDVPGGTQAATFFAEDLPHDVDSGYRAASPGSRRWALLGDSTGGYCALQLAMTNPEAFAAAAVPSGGYTAPPGADQFGGSPQIRLQDDLAWLLRHQPMQPISILFTSPGPAQPFLSQARPPMRVGQAGLPAGKWPLAGVLDWAGATLGLPAGSRA